MFAKLAILAFALVGVHSNMLKEIGTLSIGKSWNNVNLRSGKPVKVVANVNDDLDGDLGDLDAGELDGGIGKGLGGGYGKEEKIIDYLAPAKYDFKYGVADSHTGDNKEQQEIREGDVVKGEYSLAEPDGTIRIVKYIADKKRGFNAQVIRKGHAIHPKVNTKVSPVAIFGKGLSGDGGY